MQEYGYYTQVLKDQLKPATGCTEPIALAYAAAIARKILGEAPLVLLAEISSSIIKNVKSVVVPTTGGLKGIETAIAAGIVAGDPEAELEVLSKAPANTGVLVKEYLDKHDISVKAADSDRLFDIQITAKTAAHTAFVRIVDTHTNVVTIKLDDRILEQKPIPEAADKADDGTVLEITKIVEYAKICKMEDVAQTIEQQIACNRQLSAEGMTGSWGVEIGKILMASEEKPDVKIRAMAAAAAGSDARMSGCELPAVINSGSGNQGLTITLPILEYAKELSAPHEKLIRALVLANLIAVRIKQSIGYLSAYCGAICAGCAAAAGVAFLHDADETVINHTVVNGLAILSGTICDGAKPSCASKIAMAVYAGLLGFEMARQGKEFVHGEGIVKKGIENTIKEVGVLSREGMGVTNQVILNIMIKK